MSLYRPIQKIPSGLLGFLQLKNSGQNPSELPSLLQPILELRDWYFAADARNFYDSAGNVPIYSAPNNTVGFVGFATGPTLITVPQDEMWFIQDYLVATATLIATDTIQFAAGFRTPDVGVSIQNMMGDPSVLSTGPNRRAYAWARGLFVPPGSQIGAQVLTCQSLGTITLEGHLRYVPLPV